ncbi:hypothetical protein G8J22_02705 [Lentilactobacillus hilgardii]|uniref:hypothetical protein n=1 Tax=Lentilactobacillus hilgardii TaxID=1588 RepID=UPI00019C5676|nr:hypothetical protein [Lentilactobacillus hilgardii]EEI21124.1 hypothetical protein HMPREF0497_0192 [Lentilactobacillus buchneri ATCC 11577]MCT3396206.1 hypothetical protein [Lentilactobacillus hilgardii]QIR10694.1 hypothetical protein G8J22_02705 [Lentilactobacillus hilgardii]
MKHIINKESAGLSALLLTLIIVPFLSGCSGSQSKSLNKLMSSTKKARQYPFRKYDWVKVSTANGKEVAQITNRRDVIYISDIVGDAANVDQVGLGKKYLNKAHLNYRYTFYQAKPKVAIHMSVYSDSKHAQVTNIPVIRAVHYKLSETNYQKLNHPFQYLNAVHAN